MDRRRAITFFLSGLISAVLGAFGVIALASSAHAGTAADEIVLVSTKPVDGAELNAAPSEIVLNFQDRLPAMFASIQLQNANRELISLGDPLAINNRTGLRILVLASNGLPAGKYTVTWLVRPTNGKEVTDSFSFELIATAVTTTVPDSSDSSGGTTVKVDAEGLGRDKTSNFSGLLGILGRALGYIGLAGIAGGLLLIAVSWAEGVEYVLTVRHLWTAWGLGVVGCLLMVGTAASDASGISIARGLIPTEWGDLLKTTFGKALIIRLVAVAGCAWVAHRPERVVDSGTQLMALGIPAIALATYGWGPESENVSAAIIPAGIAHALGGAVWFGGAALLARVVLAGPGDHDLVKAVKGFRRLYLPAVLLVLVSGAVQTSVYLGGTGALFDTTFGRIFLLKIMVVAVMAFVATANRQFARHRLARARQLDARPAERLRRSVRTEMSAGALVFLLAGWLVGTGAPANAPVTPTASKNVYESTDGRFRASIEFGKTRVKAKVELHFRLLEPESIKNGVVTFTPKNGRTWGIEVPIAGSPAYGFGPDQGFEFGSSGTWIITVSADGPDGKALPTITREFTVNNQDGSAPVATTSTTSPSTTRPTAPPVTTAP